MEPRALVETVAPCSVTPAVGRETMSAAPLRVLAVVPGDGSGFIFVKRQLASLRLLGVEVHEVCLPSRTSPRQLFHSFRQIRKEVRAWHPGLVHAHYGTMTSFLCALNLPVPLVVTFRGSDLNPHSSLGRLRRGLGRLLSQLSVLRAVQVTCVSSQLLDQLWWGRGKATIIPSGVNLEIFRPRPSSEARRALGWPADEKVVLLSIASEPVAKGLKLVEEAISRAQAVAGTIRLRLLDGTVPPDAVPLFLNAANCLAMASLREGSPNIVKEALACNLPVVSVDVGDVRERLAGVSPSSIVARDPGEFAAALAEILQQDQRSNGREKVASVSEPVIAEALLDVYARALGSSGTGCP